LKNEKLLAMRELNSITSEKRDEKKKKIVIKKGNNIPKSNETKKLVNSSIMNPIARESTKKISLQQATVNNLGPLNNLSISALRRGSLRSLEKKNLKPKEGSTDKKKTSTKEIIKTEYSVEKVKININVNNVKNIRTILNVNPTNPNPYSSNINTSTVIKRKQKY
jgi:hypothetical protein